MYDPEAMLELERNIATLRGHLGEAARLSKSEHLELLHGCIDVIEPKLREYHDSWDDDRRAVLVVEINALVDMIDDGLDKVINNLQQKKEKVIA